MGACGRDGRRRPLDVRRLGQRPLRGGLRSGARRFPLSLPGTRVFGGNGVDELPYALVRPQDGPLAFEDPIGLNGGMNLYAMCEADCLNHIDPTGTAIWVGTRWGVHQNINVGDPNGKYSSYSFGVDDEMSSAGFRLLWPWNEAGVVYHDNPPSSVDNDLCMPTAKEQDVFAEDFLDGLVWKS